MKVSNSGFVLLDRSGRISHACENSRRMLGILRIEYSWKNRQVEIEDGLAGLAKRVEWIVEGRPAPPPEVCFGYSGGEVWFRAHGLQQALEGAERVVLVTVEQREFESVYLLRGLRTLPLSSQESDVCFWLSQGMTTTTVANRMGLKPSTVKAYGDSAYTKLGIASREELRDTILSEAQMDRPGARAVMTSGTAPTD
jgi:DNA-binding CsgD family transcriptional regulator